MARIFSKPGLRGQSALENADIDAVDPADAGTRVPEGVPDEIVELNAADQDIANDEADADTLVAAIEALESFAEPVQASLGDRGLTPREAQFMNLSLEAILCKPLGIKFTMPSMEAFGAEGGSRIASSRIVLEGFKETMQKLWQWLVDLFTSAKKRIVDYYLRVWDQAPRQIAQLEQLRDKASAITSAAKNKEMEVSTGLVAHLGIAGNIDNIPAKLGAIGKVADSLFKTYVEKAEAWSADVATAVSSLDFSDDTKFTAGLDAVTKLSPLDITAVGLTFKDVGADDKRFKGAQGVTFKTTEPLMGDRAIVAQIATAPASGNTRELIAAIGKTNLRVDAATDDVKKIESSVKMAPLPAKALEDIASAAIDVAVKVKSFKAKWDTANKTKDTVLSKLKSTKSKMAGADKLSSENQSAASSALKLLAAIPTVLDQPNQGFVSYLMNANVAVIKYLSLNLSKY